ncbi:MAG: paraquat-inducible membrane protein A [Nevskiaceae bacterium]|nr:MAG: paraquat-inducible membrane protein A [Nevskiaceae bacterium]
MNVPRACDLGLIGCDACGKVLQARQHAEHCPRCDAPLRRRKPDSLVRSWALLLSAAILYVPANLLPIMHTVQLLNVEHSTILSGVVLLWKNGSWDLAIIVFVASIVVPLVKIVCLALLLLTAQSGSTWAPRERTQLYRVLEFIGHWSMLDVFVVALLMTLVHFGKFAQVEAGAGVVAFCAVVVLTMLASMSFDPRLIWDQQTDRDAARP